MFRRVERSSITGPTGPEGTTGSDLPRVMVEALDPGPYRLRMGLRPLDPADWILVDELAGEERAEKLRLLATRPDDVVGHLGDVEAESAEVLDVLVEHLVGRFPDRFARRGDLLDDHTLATTWDLADPGLHPIDLAGRLVQEDLCLLTPAPTADDPGRLVFAAGSVCFPTRWALHDKLGADMRHVHAPVPRYDDALAAPVDATLGRLRGDRPVWRLNWSLLDDPALFQPGGHLRRDPRPGVGPGTAGTRLFLRVERQTLRRLPLHGTVLFTIRVVQRPLRALTRAEDAARLAAAIRALPDDVAAYKSIPAMVDAALGYLDERS